MVCLVRDKEYQENAQFLYKTPSFTSMPSYFLDHALPKVPFRELF